MEKESWRGERRSRSKSRTNKRTKKKKEETAKAHRLAIFVVEER
jgi:hypothetical protein